MVDRKDVGGWLDGPQRRPREPGAYAGQRLGLPADGPGSLATFGRRLVAYLVDALSCTLIAAGLFCQQSLTVPVFAAEVMLLTWLAHGSAGQIATGLRVVRLDRAPMGLPRAALRTLLICLLIPALVWDRDGRGLHDRSVGTAVVRAR